MHLRAIAVLALSLAPVGCARDNTITHGADGSPEWSRRLASAIPLGMSVDSTQATMTRNGFRCETPASDANSLWCDKLSGGRFAIVRRRWQASIAIANGRVRAVRGTTGLIGP